MPAQEKHTAAIRYGALCLLVANDTMLVLLMRLSRVQRVALGPRYLASTAVFSAEVLKLLVCGVVVWRQSGARFCETLRHQVLVPREVVKLSLPAFLYVVQNNLLYVALTNLRATPYKVTYNLKLLTAAFFSVTILGKKLDARRWFSLAALCVGVVVVQLGKHEARAGSRPWAIQRRFNVGVLEAPPEGKLPRFQVRPER